MALALDILEDGPQPDIMLVKLCDLDSARHTYGVESEQAETQLRMHDEQLGAILECLRRKGTLDETNIIVLGDHGQTDIRDAFLMNVYFRQLGLLSVDAEGRSPRSTPSATPPVSPPSSRCATRTMLH